MKSTVSHNTMSSSILHSLFGVYYNMTFQSFSYSNMSDSHSLEFKRSVVSADCTYL